MIWLKKKFLSPILFYHEHLTCFKKWLSCVLFFFFDAERNLLGFDFGKNEMCPTSFSTNLEREWERVRGWERESVRGREWIRWDADSVGGFFCRILFSSALEEDFFLIIRRIFIWPFSSQEQNWNLGFFG